MKIHRLEKNFFLDDVLDVSKNILGKILVRKINKKELKFKIVEVEAYKGPEDKACHAYNNKMTKRTETMFKEGGVSYIYQIYGIYFCLNVVVEKENIPQAILIRGIEPMEDYNILWKNRKNIKKINLLTNGPSKLCQALEINKELNSYDLVNGNELYICEEKKEKNIKILKTIKNIDNNILKIENRPFDIVASKRVGIDYANEYKNVLWRFYIKNNRFISKK